MIQSFDSRNCSIAWLNRIYTMMDAVPLFRSVCRFCFECTLNATTSVTLYQYRTRWAELVVLYHHSQVSVAIMSIRELHPDNVTAFAFTLFTSRNINKQNVNKICAQLHSFIIVIISRFFFSFFKIVRTKVMTINYKLTLNANALNIDAFQMESVESIVHCENRKKRSQVIENSFVSNLNRRTWWNFRQSASVRRSFQSGNCERRKTERISIEEFSQNLSNN